MTNTLYLPELREMLAEKNAAELEAFCTALHPARTAEFMEGLTPLEAWEVLQFADEQLRVEIFGFLEEEAQVTILETVDRAEVAGLIAEMPPDDRVDLLKQAEPEVVEELMALVPAEERRDIQRLSEYPEHTAGAVMTSEFARLSEYLQVDKAIEEIRRQSEQLETIYYLYVVDQEDHLRGLLSFRQLISAMGKPNTVVGDLMERDLVTVDVDDDQEEVAEKVARYNLLAIPVVDDEHRLVGIITHDDVLDVMVEEATEDAYRIAAVEPLKETYLDTGILTLSWKRGIWLTILFFGALLTAIALDGYKEVTDAAPWLVLFIPLVISTGGNTGNQSATLIITALSRGDITLRDWWRVVRRELAIGLLLGSVLGLCGFGCGLAIMASRISDEAPPGVESAQNVPTTAPDSSTANPEDKDKAGDASEHVSLEKALWMAGSIPITLLVIVICGTLFGSILPLVFQRLGLDPAMMSNAFVAGLIDVVGIIIYMQVIISLGLASTI
jgi:magnesium transporter